jgi:sRNA-binding carbon storage regulator CsrA
VLHAVACIAQETSSFVTRPAFPPRTFCNALPNADNGFFPGAQRVLVVSRKENESIKIEPMEGIDPSLTLHEVFAHGPIVLTLKHVGTRRVRIVVDAPGVLRIMRAESSAES